jgi:hypothetical protein
MLQSRKYTIPDTSSNTYALARPSPEVRTERIAEVRGTGCPRNPVSTRAMGRDAAAMLLDPLRCRETDP